jgi:hypothetical protein
MRSHLDGIGGPSPIQPYLKSYLQTKRNSLDMESSPSMHANFTNDSPMLQTAFPELGINVLPQEESLPFSSIFTAAPRQQQQIPGTPMNSQQQQQPHHQKKTKWNDTLRSMDFSDSFF